MHCRDEQYLKLYSRAGWERESFWVAGRGERRPSCAGRTHFMAGSCGLFPERSNADRYRRFHIGIGFEFNAPHPYDTPGKLENRPQGPLRAGNSQTLKDFLYFSGSTGVPQEDAVAGSPGAEAGHAASRSCGFNPHPQPKGGRVRLAGDGDLVDSRGLGPADGRTGLDAQFASCPLGVEAFHFALLPCPAG